MKRVLTTAFALAALRGIPWSRSRGHDRMTSNELFAGTEMGPVPDDLDLSLLIGRQLNQICIGPFDVQFRFDCDRFIACQGRVIIECNGQSVTVFDREWKDAAPLTRIAGRDVEGWKIEGTHEFSVSLTDHAKIRFISEDSAYEDFVISGLSKNGWVPWPRKRGP